MPTRKLFQLNDKNENNCNLTELSAAEAVERLFTTHCDWLGHVNRYSFVWKLLTTGSLKNSTSLLDVGCGLAKDSGSQLPYFMWRNRCKPVDGFQYWGMDLRMSPSHVPAEDKGWKVPMNFIKMDIIEDDPSQCEGWPGQFDIVVAFEVMEHLPRSKGVEFIQKLFNWTKPGGTCLFSTPNAGVSDSTAENHVDPDSHESREWTYDEKMELVEDAGFQVLDTFGTFCGTTRLPEDVQARLKTDPEWSKIKKFLSHAMLTSIISVPYPQCSNNALFHMERPV